MRVAVPRPEDDAHRAADTREFMQVTEASFGELGRDEPQASHDTIQSLALPPVTVLLSSADAHNSSLCRTYPSVACMPCFLSTRKHHLPM